MGEYSPKSTEQAGSFKYAARLKHPVVGLVKWDSYADLARSTKDC